MATARKLPSGSWRCQVFSHKDENGKRIYKSFTCPDPSPQGKKICEAEASAWMKDRAQHIKSSSVTLGDAMDAYIDNRKHLLSPNTIKDYKCTRKHHVQDLMDISVDDLTTETIQRAINVESVKHSPKTVRNVNAFITAVLKVYRPGFAPSVSLPQRTRVNYDIPLDDDVKHLLEDVRGTEMELPVMLAAFGPMRRGEICALRSDNISGNVVHVCENMIAEGDTWIIRHPKSYAGDRYIDYPDFVAKLWKGKTGRIVNLTPTALSRRFERIQHRLGIKFRFHDLRHYSASIQHAMGIPDAYIMQRGGWASDGVLKQVYRHTLEDKTKEMSRKVNGYFEAMQHEMQHENKKAPKKSGRIASRKPGSNR